VMHPMSRLEKSLVDGETREGLERQGPTWLGAFHRVAEPAALPGPAVGAVQPMGR
jgi:hypothetical protein